MKKRIVVLATGGTIAGVGEAGKNLGYRSGQLSVEYLVASMENLLDGIDVELQAEQVCNVNSDDMTDVLWLSLVRRINELQKDPSVNGIVVTHGTDTMDETAFFVDLTMDGNKPVIFTGSMRPATAKEPDGPKNLADSIKAACSLSELGRCVLVCFGGCIYEASKVQKLNASALNPMGVHYAGEGAVFECNQVVFGSVRSAGLRFDVSSLSALPKVNVLYFAVDSDPRLLEYAASLSDGLVIAGAGAGEFSLGYADALSRVSIPVVIASRIGQGLVTLNKDLAPRGIPAGELPPQKAAVLLRLALTKTKDPAEICRIFQ